MTYLRLNNLDLSQSRCKIFKMQSQLRPLCLKRGRSLPAAAPEPARHLVDHRLSSQLNNSWSLKLRYQSLRTRMKINNKFKVKRANVKGAPVQKAVVKRCTASASRLVYHVIRTCAIALAVRILRLVKQPSPRGRLSKSRSTNRKLTTLESHAIAGRIIASRTIAFVTRQAYHAWIRATAIIVIILLSC